VGRGRGKGRGEVRIGLLRLPKSKQTIGSTYSYLCTCFCDLNPKGVEAP